MSDLPIDVIKVFSTDGAALTTALDYEMCGFEETLNRLGAKLPLASGGTMLWYWPRVNDNIALKDNYISNDGGDDGVSIDDAGNVSILGTGTQLELAYDGTHKSSLAVNSAGNLAITSPSGIVTITSGKSETAEVNLVASSGSIKLEAGNGNVLIDLAGSDYDIVNKLGRDTQYSSFVVTDVNDVELLSVDGAGSVKISNDLTVGETSSRPSVVSGLVLSKYDDNGTPYFSLQCGHSSVDSIVGGINGWWKNEVVASIDLMSGDDTVNFDEGWISLKTRDSGDASPQERVAVSKSGLTTFRKNIAIGSNYISNDGDDEGISIDADGRITITSVSTLAGLKINNGSDPMIDAYDNASGRFFVRSSAIQITETTGANTAELGVTASGTTLLTGAGTDLGLKLGDSGGANVLNILDSTGATVSTIDSDGNVSFDGTLTPGSNIILGSNYLSGDGGDEGISIDASGNVTVSADITVTGNNIKDAGGSQGITFDGSGNTTIDGTLTLGGVIETAHGISMTNATNDISYVGLLNLVASTSDGSDNAQLALSSGGAASQTRGAYMFLNGNETSFNGDLRMYAGDDAASGNINLYTGGSVARLQVKYDGGVSMYALKSGTTQVAAGASASELWVTASHATLPDNVLMLGA